MRQSAAILFLAMCASGMAVAWSWDMPAIGAIPSDGSAVHRAKPALADAATIQAPAVGDVNLTVTFQGQPAAGQDLRASVSAPEGINIVSWTLDDAPAWVRLASSGSTATLSGTVPADAAGVSFTVAATDSVGRTFYAGSGDMPMAGEVQTTTPGASIGSAMALPSHRATTVR